MSNLKTLRGRNISNKMARYTRYSGRWRKWSKDELIKLRNKFIEGDSIKSIAKDLNRNNDAVVYRLIKIGILGNHNEGRLPPENHNQRWSEREKTKLLNEYNKGWDIGKIANEHKRYKNSILYRLIELNAFDFTNRNELNKYLNKDLVKLIDKKGDIDNYLEDIEKADISYDEDDETMIATPITKTKEIEPKGTIFTGRKDAIFLKNRYQKEVDNSWAEIVNMVHYIELKSKKLKESYNKSLGLKQDIGAYKSERNELYDNLSNLLTKETNFEDKMWQTTQKGRKVNSITVKQKFSESDVDEMRFDSMKDYLKQYPEYTSKARFKRILENIENKEADIRKVKKRYNESVSKYNYLLSFFEKHIQKAKDKIKRYKELLKEANRKIDDGRYKRSIFYKFASEETKAEVEIDTLSHRLSQFENTLDIIQSDFKDYKRKTFVEMDY